MATGLTEILARIPHDGVRARLADFVAKFPQYEATWRDCGYDDDGNVSVSKSTTIGDTADAVVKHVEHLLSLQWQPCDRFATVWDSFHSDIRLGDLVGCLQEGIVGDCGRVTFLTADALRKRAEEAERIERERMEGVVVSLNIDATVGTVEWFDALRMACEAANERHNDEQAAERYMTARACGQSIEGYYSDEDGVRSHTASVHDAWAWACENMPLAYGRWLESQQANVT